VARISPEWRVAGPEARIRLFCFAHAGGGAAFFRPWHGRLGPDVQVCPVVLPGREARWRERPHTQMDELVEGTMEELRHRLDPPFALFGHSMGAAVVYELCRRFFPAPGSGPLHLFVSGRRAPHLPARHPPVHRLPREQFLQHLDLLNGIPPGLTGDRDLIDAFLPSLRADFEVSETYAPPGGPPLPVGVSAMLGADDPAVNVHEMLGWRDVTDGRFSLRVFTGDHFYLRGGCPDLFAAVRQELTRAIGRVA